MEKKAEEILQSKLDTTNFQKLVAVTNQKLYAFVAKYLELCNPASVFVGTDAPEDLDYVKRKALENYEEAPLKIEGHTVHFDAYGDQGRDKAHTRVLVPKGVELGSEIVTGDRETDLAEVHDILKDMMRGRELFIRFFCLGPTNSVFSIPCVQLTDSAYVAHSEDILYRQGYEEFKRQGENAQFFRFVHSQGELDVRHVSKNLAKRRIYIDREGNTVYSTNTQYGGNTLGLKKLAMRLAIARGSKEGWLTEHMLLMGVHGPGGRKTYFTGAFPSMCGKTSTAMLEGETIVGDDIAYLRIQDGKALAANVEKGMFGIIQGVNSQDDPIQWKALHSPGEKILSNVLVLDDGSVHWIGKDGEIPEKGFNHAGEWFKGQKDANGKEIPPSHPNARFTLGLSSLENVDPALHDPAGVVIGGIIYGGRDSDTWVPVEEAFDWEHGIITKGASIESETTAATLGKEGLRAFNPMSNLDFLSIPVGRYIEINLEFGKRLTSKPLIFGVNYFLKDKSGNFLNGKNDKKVWLKWAELRVNGDVEAIKTPTGYIPHYRDLRQLFQEVLGAAYSAQDYVKQFSVRVPENLAKIERITVIFQKMAEAPARIFEVLAEQKQRLLEIKKELGDYIAPDKM